MAKIKAFNGIRYNLDKVKDYSRVVAPPYDVISKKLQNEYYNRHENNTVRLTLGKINPTDNDSDNRYTRAKSLFEDWLKRGTLIQDNEPSLYIYEQRYLHKNEIKTRLGFISLMRIEDPHKSRVLPHEYTLAKPKKDRLELYKITKTNLSPIFSLFEDEAQIVTNALKKNVKGIPIIDIEQDGVTHKVWRLSNPDEIEMISGCMKDKPIYIADGHHRYEVALSLRDWARKKGLSREGESGYEYLMVYFSSLDPNALTILSTHRVIKSVKGLNVKEARPLLEKHFKIESAPDKDALLLRLERAERDEFICGMYSKETGFFSLTQKRSADKLDVAILHKVIFDQILDIKEKLDNRDNIVYTRDADYAVKLVDREGFGMAFFLNPPKIEEVRSVAVSRERMPKKTTYFYPKLLSGLVFYKI